MNPTPRPPHLSRRRNKRIATPAPDPRRDALRNELPATVESLLKRRADLVDNNLIEQYVALSWLEWNGGSLRLTTTGENICAQIRAGIR